MDQRIDTRNGFAGLGSPPGLPPGSQRGSSFSCGSLSNRAANQAKRAPNVRMSIPQPTSSHSVLSAPG